MTGAALGDISLFRTICNVHLAETGDEACEIVVVDHLLPCDPGTSWTSYQLNNPQHLINAEVIKSGHPQSPPPNPTD
jgi:hypothetical protein